MCWTALAHGSAAQHRRGNLILGDSSGFLSFGGFGGHSISFPLSPKRSCALHVPVPCSYLSWGHLTAAPSASSANGLLCWNSMN